jgi:TadE-like protein
VRLGDDRGGGGIEMAIILPLLLTSVFAIAHMAMYHLARQAALSVAQVAVEGERSWLAEPGAGYDRAHEFYDGLPAVLGDMDVTITNDGEHATATVTGNPVAVIPWFPYTVTQTASAPVERVT